MLSYSTQKKRTRVRNEQGQSKKRTRSGLTLVTKEIPQKTSLRKTFLSQRKVDLLP